MTMKRREAENPLEFLASMAGFPYKLGVQVKSEIYFSTDPQINEEFMAARTKLVEDFLAKLETLAKDAFGDDNVTTSQELHVLYEVCREAMRTRRQQGAAPEGGAANE